MPQNKRESLIYTVLMCFCMVLWMSMYNVTLHMGGFSMEVLKEGWLGFPIAYVFAMCCDWFLVSGLAKKFAFTYLVKPEDSVLKKSDLRILFHGRTDGTHHVHVRCCGRMCALRCMVPAADDLADQHPQELYHGSSFPADRSRTAGSFHLPFCIPGRQGTGVTQHKIRESGVKRYHFPGFFIYASNAPKSMLVLDLGDCRDNSRNLQSVFLIVFSALLSTL